MLALHSISPFTDKTSISLRTGYNLSFRTDIQRKWNFSRKSDCTNLLRKRQRWCPPHVVTANILYTSNMAVFRFLFFRCHNNPITFFIFFFDEITLHLYSLDNYRRAIFFKNMELVSESVRNCSDTTDVGTQAIEESLFIIFKVNFWCIYLYPPPHKINF